MESSMIVKKMLRRHLKPRTRMMSSVTMLWPHLMKLTQ
nr:MAG TPA: hypothetical protein [Caudoviricetes sp.]